MRRRLFILLLLAACGSDQVFEHDLEPIQLSRAPIEPGGAMMGGLLAAVSTVAGIEPLLVDTAFPIDSLGRAGCAAGGACVPGCAVMPDSERSGATTRRPVRSRAGRTPAT